VPQEIIEADHFPRSHRVQGVRVLLDRLQAVIGQQLTEALPGFYSTDYKPSSASSSPKHSEKDAPKDEGKAAKPAKETASTAKKEKAD